MRMSSFYPCTWLLTVLHVKLKMEIIFVHNFRGICHDLPACPMCVCVGGALKYQYRTGELAQWLRTWVWATSARVKGQAWPNMPLQYQLWSSGPGIGWEVKGCYCWGQIQDDLWDFLASAKLQVPWETLSQGCEAENGRAGYPTSSLGLLKCAP